jgi:hypothetical protein
MNKYVFNVKFSNIKRLSQTLPIEAESLEAAQKIVMESPRAEYANLLAVKVGDCWYNEEPTFIQLPLPFLVQLPIPNDPRIFNKPQVDGSYRPLSEFFDGVK